MNLIRFTAGLFAILFLGFICSAESVAQLSTSPNARALRTPIRQAVGGTNRNITIFSNRGQTIVVQQNSVNGRRTITPGLTYGRYTIPNYPYPSGYPTSRFGPYDRSSRTTVPAQRVIRTPARRSSRSIRVFSN